MFDILVLGELNADLILSGDVEPVWAQAEKLIDDATLTLGSSSAIFACGAARLGLKVAFAGVIGDDLIGHFCRDQLASHGVDLTGLIVDPAERTGMTIILQRTDDRAMLTFPGALPALTTARVAPELLTRCRHVHVGSYYMQLGLHAGLASLFGELRRAGVTTSLDTNWDPSNEWSGLDALLAETDIFLPNEAEACAIAGIDSWQQALKQLATRIPTVAIKRGSDGAVAQRGDEQATTSIVRVDVVDSVGAGDSFDAGFVYGFLQGWPLQQTLDVAAVCGSLSTRAAGGTTAQATHEEAIRFAKTLHTE